jgi:hypothetical protein
MKNKENLVDEAHPDYKEVVIEERIEYGIKRYYPINDLGKKFAERMGTKTLSLGTLDFIIKELDIPVNFKPNDVLNQFLN